MAAARALPEYRADVLALLETCATTLTADEQAAVRSRVRELRRGKRSDTSAPAQPRVERHATAIVAVLDGASRDLRPRETQELDDLVAGKPVPVPGAEERYAPPVRRRRRGAL